MKRRALGWVAGGMALGGAVAAYVELIRPRLLRWGATGDELSREMPGDELLPEPKVTATRAITIDAPPAEVWPWVVQVGQGSGGPLGYRWLERGVGLNIRRAERMLPGQPGLAADDEVLMEPAQEGPIVLIAEPEKVLVLGGMIDAQDEDEGEVHSRNPVDFFATSWTFQLEPLGAETTRLVERQHFDWFPSARNNALYHALLEPVAFIMARRMLRGIKRRAEHAYRAESTP